MQILCKPPWVWEPVFRSAGYESEKISFYKKWRTTGLVTNFTNFSLFTVYHRREETTLLWSIINIFSSKSVANKVCYWHTKSEIVVPQAVLTISTHTNDNKSPEVSEATSMEMVWRVWRFENRSSLGYRLNINIKCINDLKLWQLIHTSLSIKKQKKNSGWD